MARKSNVERIQKWIREGGDFPSDLGILYPPAIAVTLGFRLVGIDEGSAIVECVTDPKVHGNPMGTIHGGLLGDLGDFAIGTAHSTWLTEGESFTSVDLQINFFRPLWHDTIVATARTTHVGKTIARYTCEITKKGDGKLVAQVMSTVMTLRGESAKGR